MTKKWTALLAAIILAFAIMLTGCGSTETESPSADTNGESGTEAVSIDFTPYSEAALEEAKAEGKPVMIDFTAHGCPPCKMMEENVFNDPDVVNEAERFTTLKVQCTLTGANPPQVQEYNISGFPSIVFIDSEGNQVGSAFTVGYVDANELISKMQQVN